MGSLFQCRQDAEEEDVFARKPLMMKVDIKRHNLNECLSMPTPDPPAGGIPFCQLLAFFGTWRTGLWLNYTLGIVQCVLRDKDKGDQIGEGADGGWSWEQRPNKTCMSAVLINVIECWVLVTRRTHSLWTVGVPLLLHAVGSAPKGFLIKIIIWKSGCCHWERVVGGRSAVAVAVHRVASEK